MKQLLLFIALIYANLTSAQCLYPFSIHNLNEIDVIQLDSSPVKYTYRFKCLADTINSVQYDPDIQVLLVGKNVSKYYSQKLMDATMEGTPGSLMGVCPFEVFKSYPKEKMTVTEIGNSFILGSDFKYEEDIPKLKWKLQTDTMSVLNYICQKATTTFRGRSYEAWYTKDISIRNGPWKFGGLPGLILKISDDRNHIDFECIQIENLPVPQDIVFYKFEYTETTREEHNKRIQGCLNDVVGYCETNYCGLAGQTDYIAPIPYNPIELE